MPITTGQILAALADVIDPEVGEDIVAIGLIYDVAIGDAAITVTMTMTSAACPMGDLIIDEVRNVLAAVAPEDTGIRIDLVWEPAWTPGRMSPALRQRFGWQA
ncbi:metal-sulfur cluster assembly factor [Jeongeupia wiesaeckerbachi]|uniref:metal-sulfur cluster assembly factor n=1 Tax=Jeongeupia wiesaeckerbachi TaxID=3051218 RepID=UPI003D8049BD